MRSIVVPGWGFPMHSPNFPCLDWLGCLGKWTGERIQQEREGQRGPQHKFNFGIFKPNLKDLV